MGRYKLSSIAAKMRELVLSLLLLPTLAMSQCANEMPSGRCCEADGFFAEADPEACSFYYDCVEGTIFTSSVSHSLRTDSHGFSTRSSTGAPTEKMLTVAHDRATTRPCVPHNHQRQHQPQRLTAEL